MTLIIQWILALYGISEKERVNVLVKMCVRVEQHSNSISFCGKKIPITAGTMPWVQRDDYHLLTMEQVVPVRLHTEHNMLKSSIHHKLKFAPTPISLCSQKDKSTEHLQQGCPFHKALREGVWSLCAIMTTRETTATFTT